MDYYIKNINSCESRILDKIDIIKRYGIDVINYENDLKSILEKQNYDKSNEINNEINGNISLAVKTLNDENYNREVLKKLEDLEERLNSYQSYLTLYFKNRSLYMNVLNCKSLSDEKINNYVSEAISLIKTMDETNLKNVSESKKNTLNVYSTIYEIIKLELIYYSESKLLEYLLKNDLGIEYINDIVREDLKKLKDNGLFDENIEKIVYELSEEGINYNFADNRLILSIILKTDDRVVDILKEKLNLCDQELIKLYDQIGRLEVLRDNSKSRTSLYKSRKNKSQIKSAISAIMLAFNILAFKFGDNLIKKDNTDITFMTNREAYDTVSNEVKSENVVVHKGESEYSTLKVYGEVNENGERKITTYKLDNSQLEDIRDYLDLDNSKEDYSTNTINYRLGEQLSRDEYTVVERMHYGEEYHAFDEEQYNKELQKFMIAIYALGGIFTTSMLVYLFNTFIYKKRIKEEQNMHSTYDNKIDQIKSETDQYIKSKFEITSIIDDYSNISADEYKAKVYVKSKK